MKTNNTIAAFHITGKDHEGHLKLRTTKLYHWNIPKRLRKDPIQKGDIVSVDAKTEKAPVLVMDVFREEFEETQKLYRKIRRIIERAPEK